MLKVDGIFKLQAGTSRSQILRNPPPHHHYHYHHAPRSIPFRHHCCARCAVSSCSLLLLRLSATASDGRRRSGGSCQRGPWGIVGALLVTPAEAGEDTLAGGRLPVYLCVKNDGLWEARSMLSLCGSR